MMKKLIARTGSNSKNSSNEHILEVKDISVSFGGVQPVRGVSFGLTENSFTSIIGPNGAGKTSLFNLISGINKVDAGEIIFRGEALQDIHIHKIAQKGLVRTFQGAKVIRRLTVAENLMMAVQGNPGDNLRGFLNPRARGSFESKSREEAMRRLEQVGLTKFADEFAGILSGGQRKLLDLSRALMTKPSLLLLDEPFAGVNPTLVEKLLNVLEELRKDQEMTFLLIEHDLETVMRISDRVIVMAEGKIIADGLPNSIYESEVVIDAYLGSRRRGAK
ncbi:MAG: ABC transporter ATP-binding protein [Actinomycetota bacterium]|tara:strand:+ start:6265 stop:7092 length:828 start_codon:yes stop_codon:yes gene_type:complete